MPSPELNFPGYGEHPHDIKLWGGYVGRAHDLLAAIKPQADAATGKLVRRLAWQNSTEKRRGMLEQAADQAASNDPFTLYVEDFDTAIGHSFLDPDSREFRGIQKNPVTYGKFVFTVLGIIKPPEGRLPVSLVRFSMGQHPLAVYEAEIGQDLGLAAEGWH